MDINLLLAVIGIVIGIASLVYAVMTNRDKARLEKLVQAELRGLAGNIDEIRANPKWAYEHFKTIQAYALKLEERSDSVNRIHEAALYGTGDALATERLLGNLLNQVLTLQDGLFGTKVIEHCDRSEKEEKA